MGIWSKLQACIRVTCNGLRLALSCSQVQLPFHRRRTEQRLGLCCCDTVQQHAQLQLLESSAVVKSTARTRLLCDLAQD